MLRFFRSLRGKLILTYTLVTVLALLALEVLVLLAGVLLSSVLNAGSNARPYLSDVIYVLYPQARNYLQPGSEQIPGLQAWLEGVYASGRASLEPQDWSDSPAAIIVREQPMYVLSPNGVVLAQAPAGQSSLVGRRYTPPDLPRGQKILKNAFQRELDPLRVSALTPDGNYLMCVPILQGDRDSPLVGVIVLTVKPPPPMLITLWPLLVGGVLLTGVLLLAGVAPFGALFGFIMSRGLTRRLKALTTAADAWSEGNFSLQPQDRSQDEIGILVMRMRNMAERVQTLLQSQQELAMLEERNRLARDLHDTVKQQTFATLMQVRAAKNMLERDPIAAGQRLAEAEDLLKASQQELSLMIAELRPAALDGQGLAGALRRYLDTWSQHTRIPATIQVQNERGLPLPVEQAMYRVAQEALANVARHSRASAVALRLDYALQQVCMVVSDNGVGFDPQAAGQAGFGLHSMQERVSALDGQFEVRSLPGDGTTITVVIPLS